MFWRKFFNRKKKLVIDPKQKNMVYIDPGASSVKACNTKGECINFRASVREILDPTEITIQENIICVNNKWYAVSENSISPSMEILKYKKKHIEVLILYAMVKLGVKDNDISVNLVLPFNQLLSKNIFAKMLSKRWSVIDNGNNTLQYNLTLRECYSEGEMSIYLINMLYNNVGKNVIVINIGYSTIDIIVVSKDGSREKLLSIPIGMRQLMPIHASILGVRTGALLSSWISDGYKYPSNFTKAIKEANMAFIEEFMTEIYLTVLTIVNPQNTNCYIAGGGCCSIGKDLREWIHNQNLIKDFNVMVLDEYNALYTDLLGMYNYVNSNKKNESVTFKDNSVILENDSVKDAIIKSESVISESVKNNDDVKGYITNTGRINYNVLIPKVLESYPIKPTYSELQDKFEISKMQARKLVEKAYN